MHNRNVNHGRCGIFRKSTWMEVSTHSGQHAFTGLVENLKSSCYCGLSGYGIMTAGVADLLCHQIVNHHHHHHHPKRTYVLFLFKSREFSPRECPRRESPPLGATYRGVCIIFLFHNFDLSLEIFYFVRNFSTTIIIQLKITQLTASCFAVVHFTLSCLWFLFHSTYTQHRLKPFNIIALL